MLGNPSVWLTTYVEGEGLKKLKRAPTAADVAGLGENYYLDLNGRVLGDTCVYARDFEQLLDEGKAPVVTYAHIAREAGHPGFALQYWFFWYFNQFNDLHEGDWEGMQVTFDADGPAAGAGRRRRTGQDHPLPARRRRARRLGCRQGAEGRHAPGRLPGRRLARHLLRLRRLRAERPERVRPRLRHDHRAAARTATPPGAAAEPGDERRRVRLAQLLRPLGRTGKGLQQRPAGAADEDRLARTVHLDGSPAQRPARACRAARWGSAARSSAPSAARSPPPPTWSTSTSNRGRS